MKNLPPSEIFELVLARARTPGVDPVLDASLERVWEIKEREREAAERSGQLEEIRQRDKTLRGFTTNHWKTLEPAMELKYGWAMDAVDDHLAACHKGQIKRLLINIPPGFMKSLKAGVFFPAWMWGPMARPSLRILGAAFKQDHAIRDAEKMRDLVSSDLYQDLYPHVRLKGRGAADDWDNTATGWRKGKPIKSLTGDRGDFVIVDDPHSVEGADSETQRQATVRVMRETIPTRLNDPDKSVIIVIMQRIHEDDVSGMIIAEKLGYDHLMLPMKFDPQRRCTTSIGFTDPRKYPDELLFPERFTPEAVARTEKEMTAYAVSGQMQQRPVPREGGLFQRTDFEIVDFLPMGGTDARAWDLAGTKKSQLSPNPDWTVGLKGKRISSGTFFITDMIRMRTTPGKVAAAIKNAATQDTRSCYIRIPQDPAQAGKMQAEFIVSLLAGWPLTVERVGGDKVTRAQAAATQAEHGKIKLLRGEWNEAFLNEVCSFPSSTHDDIVDALSDLIAELSNVAAFDLSNL
jgi:predicted phage terminase large subunit-like protein